MALVVLLRKSPKHGSIVHIRFRATVLVEEKEISRLILSLSRHIRPHFSFTLND